MQLYCVVNSTNYFCSKLMNNKKRKIEDLQNQLETSSKKLKSVNESLQAQVFVQKSQGRVT
jgi:hypothetical protein